MFVAAAGLLRLKYPIGLLVLMGDEECVGNRKGVKRGGNLGCGLWVREKRGLRARDGEWRKSFERAGESYVFD